MLSKRTSLLAPLLGVALASGCAGAGAGGGDKAGGRPVSGPTVLTLANTSFQLTDVPPVAYFVRRVKQLSQGTIEIRVLDQWANYASDAEAQIVHAVAAGRADLGWAGSRVFDTIGNPSFQALSAPLLIDSYGLEKAVLASPLPARMLAGLKRFGVTGLALLGEELRVPISVKRPLVAPSDWRGVGFGTLRSGIQEEAIRALGAIPIEAFGQYRAIDLRTGRIQAFEFDLRRYVTDLGVMNAPVAVANVHLWPEFDVLLANPGRLGSLTDQQRAWLRQAAADAVSHSVALADDSSRYMQQACQLGARFENATSAELAALRSKLSAVYRQLRRDPETDGFIGEIEQLKRVTPPGITPPIPRGCSRIQ